MAISAALGTIDGDGVTVGKSSGVSIDRTSLSGLTEAARAGDLIRLLGGCLRGELAWPSWNIRTRTQALSSARVQTCGPSAQREWCGEHPAKISASLHIPLGYDN